MQRIIKNGQLIDESWHLLPKHATLDGIPNCDDLIVPLGLWVEHSTALKARDGGLGVWLDAGEEIEEIADQLDNFQVIALNFPAFTDGRHTSTAYLLRNRYGYKGEVRAIGDVLRDHKAPRDALKAFEEFSEVYQASTDQPLPLFRRRA